MPNNFFELYANFLKYSGIPFTDFLSGNGWTIKVKEMSLDWAAKLNLLVKTILLIEIFENQELFLNPGKQVKQKYPVYDYC